jgi:uncharacterized protein (DUF1330 family)
MSVIVLVQGTPHPEHRDALAEYQQTARTIIAKHGGQPVARGSGLGSLHGSGKFQVGIVIRFADQAAVEGWYNDPEYQKVLPLRHGRMRRWKSICTKNEIMLLAAMGSRPPIR